jgi:hypothetical protein
MGLFASKKRSISRAPIDLEGAELPRLEPIDETGTNPPKQLEDPFENSLPGLPDLEEEVNKEASDLELPELELPELDEPIEKDKEDEDREDPDILEFPDLSSAPFDEESEQMIEETAEELLGRRAHKFLEEKGPLFVNITGFKELLGEVDDIKKSLKKGMSALNNVMELKDLEDSKMMKWQKSLEDMERKLMYVDKILFETEHN